MTGPLLRDALPPVRAAFWSLALVVLIGLVNLLLTVVWGGALGLGVVFFALSIFAVQGVRRVAEGNRKGRTVVTVIGVVLILYRLFVGFLAVGLSDANLPGWALAVTLAQLVLEIVLIVAALVLLYRPEVTAHLKG